MCLQKTGRLPVHLVELLPLVHDLLCRGLYRRDFILQRVETLHHTGLWFHDPRGASHLDVVQARHAFSDHSLDERRHGSKVTLRGHRREKGP